MFITKQDKLADKRFGFISLLFKKLQYWVVFFVSASLMSSAWCITTPATHVASMDLIPSDGTNPDMVDVKFTATASLASTCNDKISFAYSAGTASEVYYSLLMTAKSGNLQVYVRYTDNGQLGCSLDSVVATEGELPGT